MPREPIRSETCVVKQWQGRWRPCRATTKHGNPCWKVALTDDLVPGLPLCWAHTAKVVLQMSQEPVTRSEALQALKRTN